MEPFRWSSSLRRIEWLPGGAPGHPHDGVDAAARTLPQLDVRPADPGQLPHDGQAEPRPRPRPARRSPPEPVEGMTPPLLPHPPALVGHMDLDPVTIASNRNQDRPSGRRGLEGI